MRKITRQISFDAIRSHFPGLLPYFEVEEGKVITHYCDDDPINGNWNRLVYNFILPETSMPGSYINQNGMQVFEYQELNRRYKILRKLYDDGIFLHRSLKNSEKAWIKNDRLMYLERNKWEVFDVSVCGYKSTSQINDLLENERFFANFNDEIWENNEIVMILNDKSLFDELGGYEVIDFFEQVCGIFEIPENLQNTLVPRFLPYWKLEKLYSWLYENSESKEKETQKRWKELGGLEMMKLLTRTDIREDNLPPLLFLKDTLKKVREFELIVPEFTFNLSLTSIFENLGALTEDDSVDLIEEEKRLHPKLFENNPNNPQEVVCQTESLLNRVKSEDLAYDDAGNELPGEFIRRVKSGEQGPYFYVLTLNKETREYEGEYVNEATLNKSLYIEIPFIESIFNNSKPIGRYRVDYEDTRRLVIEPENERPSYFTVRERSIINGEEVLAETWYINGKETEIIEWDDNFLPPEEENKYFKANHVIYKDGKVVINKKRIFYYQDNNWSSMLFPDIHYESLKPSKNCLRVKEGNEYVFYAVTESPMYGVYRDQAGKLEFYKSQITSAKIPFNEKKAINTRFIENTQDGRKKVYADFIDYIIREGDRVYFSYYIGAECEINKEGYVIPNSIVGNNGNGLYFQESYRLKLQEPLEIKMFGKKMTYFFDLIDYERQVVEVEKPEYGLTRKALLSNVKYNANDVWKHNPSAFNSFRSDSTIGLEFVNTPENNVVFNRGNAAAFEPRFKLMECNTMQDLVDYGNNYFNLA